MQLRRQVLCYFGLLAPVWIVVSVTYSGLLYPGYSHINQAMSELHAAGSPIETIAPYINHYPLAILFAGFGYYIVCFCKSRAARVSGYCIILHGIATFSAGYFPCDTGCSPEGTSFNHVMHGLSGLAVMLTLLIAPAIWGVIAKEELHSTWFGWLSVTTVLGQLLLLIPTFNAANSGEYFGLYQRLTYSFPLIWMFILAALLIQHNPASRAVSTAD